MRNEWAPHKLVEILFLIFFYGVGSAGLIWLALGWLNAIVGNVK